MRSDSELLARVASGERAAQALLVQRLARHVRRLALLLCANRADADDAAQRALIEILAAAHSFRGDSSLDAWAQAVAVRAIRHEARRDARRKGLLDRWLAPGAFPFGRSRPTPAGEPSDLPRLLDRLSPERREALVLRHVLEYSMNEVAAMTGVPLGTAKDRLVAARKQMRGWLNTTHPLSNDTASAPQENER